MINDFRASRSTQRPQRTQRKTVLLGGLRGALTYREMAVPPRRTRRTRGKILLVSGFNLRVLRVLRGRSARLREPSSQQDSEEWPAAQTPLFQQLADGTR